jgi:homoserine O-acetyltransferase
MTAGVAHVEYTRQLLTLDEPFNFESGERLPTIDIAYETWGTLDADGGNAVYVCHALTGDAHAGSVGLDTDDPPGWWDGLIGPGRGLDPSRYYIVCANLLGSCYGTTGPASRDPRNGEIYGMDFPQVTTRDMIRVQKRLLEALGIQHLHLIIGGSLGGMQVWQWLVDEPDFVRAGIPIAGTTQGSPWMIALNQVARQAIFNDPAWQLGRYNGTGPDAGLSLARMIAMISYRSDRQFWERFGRDMSATGTGDSRALDGSFEVENYLDHHGRKLVDRFDARAYVYLTRAMDLHDVARGYDGLDQALERIEAKVLTIGIDSDVLYYPHELRSAAEKLKGLGKDVTYEEIQTPYGHDAFLVEYDQLNRLVEDFLDVVR